MDFKEYVAQATQFSTLPLDDRFIYSYVGGLSEIGEVFGVISRLIRDNTPTKTFQENMINEIGDIWWHLSQMYLSIDPSMPMDILIYHSQGRAQGSGYIDDELIAMLIALHTGWTQFSENGVNKKDALGTVTVGLALITQHMGFTVSEVLEANISKLSGRKSRGTIQGAGDER